MTDYTATRVRVAPEALTIEWSDGAVSEFPSLWLRDNVAADRDAHSGQRLVDIADLPERAAHPLAPSPRTRACASSGSARRSPAAFSSRGWPRRPPGSLRQRPERAVRTWLEGGKLDAAATSPGSSWTRRAASRARGSRG